MPRWSACPRHWQSRDAADATFGDLFIRIEAVATREVRHRPIRGRRCGSLRLVPTAASVGGRVRVQGLPPCSGRRELLRHRRRQSTDLLCVDRAALVDAFSQRFRIQKGVAVEAELAEHR